MNNHQKSYYRDRQIQQVLTEWGCLDIFQIAILFFPSLNTAQKRMNKLTAAKRVKRTRENLGQPYCYYIDRKPEQLEHRLGVNWIRLWLMKRLKSWEQIYCWNYEVNYGALRPDGLLGIKNTATGTYRFMFIEYDRGFNKFDKVEKYERWYDSGGYTGQWWVEYVDKFPSILVVSEKTLSIKSKLNFQVVHFNNIVKEMRECRTVNLCGNL